MSSTRSIERRRRPRGNRPLVLALEGRTLLAATPRVDTFAAPTLLATPGQIIGGADGDLWFVEATGTIGRVAPTGQVVEFPPPTPADGVTPVLGGLTAGPDGAVDVANGRVDRIAHDGQVESFPLLADQVESTPSLDGLASSGSIVAGPDGDLWFGANTRTPNQPGAIDRMTPTGVLTAFPLPSGGGSAVELAAGPAGLWFTDPSANRVGTVDPSGRVAELGRPPRRTCSKATPWASSSVPTATPIISRRIRARSSGSPPTARWCRSPSPAPARRPASWPAPTGSTSRLRAPTA